MQKCLKQYLFKYSDNFIFDDNLIEPSSGTLKLLTNSLTNPSIITKKSIPLNSINSFLPVVVTPANTSITYTLIKDGQDYYYSSGWIVSDGSYAQSSTLAQIQTNIATFTTSRARVKLRIFLNTTSALATPSISSLNLSFDYTGYCTPDDVRALMGNLGNTDIDDEDIIGMIEVSDAQIDTYLVNGYTLPLTTIPNQIKGFSTVIAAYNLYTSLEITEGGATKSPQRIRYEQAIQELQDISEKKKSISGLTVESVNQMSYSTSETIEYDSDNTIMFENYKDL